MLPVRVTPRAAAEIERAAAWWLSNRSNAPGAIREELSDVFDLLSRHPHIGARALSPKLSGVRRIYLNRVGYFLYYRVTSSQLEVLAFWHSRRKGPPRL